MHAAHFQASSILNRADSSKLLPCQRRKPEPDLWGHQPWASRLAGCKPVWCWCWDCHQWCFLASNLCIFSHKSYMIIVLTQLLDMINLSNTYPPHALRKPNWMGLFGCIAEAACVGFPGGCCPSLDHAGLDIMMVTLKDVLVAYNSVLKQGMIDISDSFTVQSPIAGPSLRGDLCWCGIYCAWLSTHGGNDPQKRITAECIQWHSTIWSSTINILQACMVWWNDIWSLGPIWGHHKLSACPGETLINTHADYCHETIQKLLQPITHWSFNRLAVWLEI